MAFPTVAARTESKLVTAGTSFTINFTQTTGDLVVIFLAMNRTASQAVATLGDSFVNLTNRNGCFHIFYKELAGSEGGNVVVTFASNFKGCAIAYNIQGFNSGSAPEHSVVANGAEGSGGTPNSSNLSPSWGAADTLWITAFQENGEELDDDTWVTGTPTNYGNLTQTTSDTGGASTSNCQSASADRSLNAASEDPGNFTTAQDREWDAYTVAIQPTGAAPSGHPTMRRWGGVMGMQPGRANLGHNS